MTSTQTPAGGSGEKLTMGIDPYEKNWMRFSIVMLLVFFVTVTVAGFALGFQVNGVDQEIDPRTAFDSEPWNDPGLRHISGDHYEAYVVAEAWLFNPRTIEVPVGATVDIYVTSPDLQHGFKITDTNINMQVVPGQVSKLTYTFDQVGEFPYICTEYCGTAHATMAGTVHVVPASEFSGQQADGGAEEESE